MASPDLETGLEFGGKLQDPDMDPDPHFYFLYFFAG
jgi:hypothetical protein